MPVARLRVASYNLRDFLDDEAAARRVVRAIAPDVLLLQEVPRRLGSGRRVARFAAGVGLVWPGHHRGSGGTTVLLSPRVQLRHAEHLRLPVRPFARTRGFAIVQLALDGVELVAASVHLSLRGDERVRHARAILDRLGADAAAAELPILVAGDLNEGSDGPAWGLIAGRLHVLTGSAPTYPVDAPVHRLDVIWGDRHVDVVAEGSIDQLVADGLARRDVVSATDHLPVWSDVEVRTG
ncbi:endonuclease/exonuclease/phosphatase family protein [Arsenicicoccus piscis]|uniref:Endonuclease/exonuclease/phosphatase domain-containing protein n=1 Tax=Arsenicicoccus piscis TaxID=673954 RepID=A0ABQ6HLS3_9MICO|nr:endonuclease/exonuclease/phosphatase family protein [Arsenicicoccus piscis]MCH8628648.1 endonuclease/exonuclease/phosphatase family protein [Arsenicicoccus piscis]GMA19421.1 hypothetical protein GCM10025862_14420 [Arsenicicoccus piscis]